MYKCYLYCQNDLGLMWDLFGETEYSQSVHGPKKCLSKAMHTLSAKSIRANEQFNNNALIY
jgi:hypothetical protein